MDINNMGNSSSSYRVQQKSKNICLEEEHPYYESMQDVCSIQAIYPARAASKVLQWLYLGSCDDAYDREFLVNAGITHIINCVEGDVLPNYAFYKELGITYMGFSANDDDDYDIMSHYQSVHDFIESARKVHGKLLIHCLAGVNRSGALAVAYYMVHKEIGPIAASKHVKAKRLRLLTNETFQAQVVHLAHKMNLLHLDKRELRSSIKRKNPH